MGHACSSIVIVTITVHLGPMLDDRGFSLQTVGWVVGAYTGVAAIFTLIGGYVGDRLPIRLALFGFSAVQSGAVLVLMLADSQPMVYLFAVLMGIGFGGRNPLTTAIRGVYFGRKAFASITGISNDSDECPAAGRAAIRRDNVRRHAELCSTHGSGGDS